MVLIPPRPVYRALGASNLYPADAALNLPAGLHWHGLGRLAALESVRGSFETGAEAIWRNTGVRIGKRQVEELAQGAAVDIEAFCTARRLDAADAGQLLVMQFDGKGIVMIPAALREATAKARRPSRRGASWPPGYHPGRSTAGNGWPSWPRSTTPPRRCAPRPM